jgi:uncharacterized protein YcbX
MRIESLWRYPVKSMQGESLHELSVAAHGVMGDRSYGVMDLTSGNVISAKREGRLFDASATITPTGLRVTLADGIDYRAGEQLDAALSTWLGREVALTAAASKGAATYESQDDYEDDSSDSVSWQGPEGSFVDESPLHLLTTSDLALLAHERPDLQWEVRRFRPNVVIDAAPGEFDSQEQPRRYCVGEVQIEVVNACSRCVMTTRPQPGGLDRQLEILRHIAHVHDHNVGVRARVVKPGVMRVGAEVVPIA